MKSGPGTLDLTGASTYTGNTTVGQGTLLVNGSIASPRVFVNPGALLGGSGFVFGQVFNSGTVSPGNSPGTLHVGGNFAQSAAGTLRIEIAGRSAGQFDVLAVGGHAALDGTLELVRENNFKLKRGDRIAFLTAAQGVSGRFARVLNPFTSRTILRPEVVYENNAVALTAVQGLFAALHGLTFNQRAVARDLDRAAADPRADKLFAYLDERVLEKLPGDFDRLAPEELTSAFTLATALANVQSLNLQRRTADLRSGAQGFSAAGLAMQGSGPGYAGPLGGEGQQSKEMRAPADDRWGAFVTGSGEWVHVGSDGNGSAYDLDTGGFTLGADYKVTPHFALGLSAGYAGTASALAKGGGLNVNGGKLGLYATYFTGGFYTDAAVSGGLNSYDTRRSALRGTARGSTDGGELNALAATGYDWRRGALTLGPTATFQYTRAGLDGFTERGSLAPLRIASHTAASLRTALGFKASYDWKIGGVLVKPELRAAWQHVFADASYGLDASFANGAGGSFFTKGPEVGRDSLLLGAGLAVQWSERTAAYLYYDGELGRDRYDRHAVSGGIRTAL